MPLPHYAIHKRNKTVYGSDEKGWLNKNTTDNFVLVLD